MGQLISFLGTIILLINMGECQQKEVQQQTPTTPFTNIEKALAQPMAVKSLQLEGIDLNPYLDRLHEFVNMEDFSCNNCKLSQMPPALFDLKKLGRLDLSRNSSISNLLVPKTSSSIEKLLVAECSLTEINGISNLPQLEFLVLAENQLRDLPQDFEQLTSLKSIGLSYNYFSFFPASLKKLSTLEEITMIKTSLKSIALNDYGKLNLTGLRKLDFDYNPINSWPTDLAKLTKLQELSLRSSNINEIPPSVGELASSLKYLALSDQIPVELREKLEKWLPNTQIEYGE